VTATERVTTKNHEPPTHLVFHLLRCCAAKTTLSPSSTCIYDQECRYPKPSFSAILHRERTNKVFGKQSSQLLARFFKFFITAHLPLCRTRAKSRRFQRELRQADHHRQGTASHVRFLLSNHVLHIEYVDLRRHNFAK
jgi:hypothetical protein